MEYNRSSDKYGIAIHIGINFPLLFKLRVYVILQDVSEENNTKLELWP